MNYPFPGMDPYLEHRVLWPGVHNRLIVAFANQIQPRILPRYLASIEQRVFVEGPDREATPDIIYVGRRPGDTPSLAPSASVDSPVVLAVNDLEVHESYIQILDRHAQMRVVTVIEVVSPSNKQSRNGRRSYLAKQRETRNSDQHLVEIDLLRRGRHVLRVPQWRAADLGAYDYLVCGNRSTQRNQFELYPRGLRDRLPRIGVPLTPPDEDAPLDIQAGLEQIYQEGVYALQLRYNEPCAPALPVANQQWANQQIAAFRASRPDLFPPQAAANGAGS